MNLFRNESSIPVVNAQKNLCGRTHYVDQDTLRWHKARILSARTIPHNGMNGLLFAIVESVALDMNNTKRGVRYVIFDLFGNIVGTRRDLENCYRTSAQAEKAMWAEINTLDAKAITEAAIEQAELQHEREMRRLRETIAKLED